MVELHSSKERIASLLGQCATLAAKEAAAGGVGAAATVANGSPAPPSRVVPMTTVGVDSLPSLPATTNTVAIVSNSVRYLLLQRFLVARPQNRMSASSSSPNDGQQLNNFQVTLRYC